ncbi:MAG TPA: glycosyltransferase [Bryobacterales bacterium]|nr:glycosyltransferase [Bryobacterales bacterium]
MKIALVHDWLTGMRGGEKVLLELVRLFPSADVFTLLWRRGSVCAEIEARVRATSFLDRLPAAAKAYRYYLPLFPAAVRSLDLSGYDFVFSSSHAVAKGASIPPGAVHVSYVHTPMRYLWETRGQYFQFGQGLWWKSAALQLVSPWLRRFDASSSRGVHFFLANSENVRGRIRRIYGTEARVIYPPVDTEFFAPEECASRAPGPPGGDYYLVVSSLEPYKRIDLAVDAFSGGCRRLLVAGAGTLHNVLRARARPPVEFLGEVSDVRLRDLYRHCRALIFPGLEDFGIAPVEAQACGRPVVCYGAGGALETVSDGRTGVHFRPQTSEALLAAVGKLEKSTWDPQLIRGHSLQFSRERFRKELMSFLYDAGILAAA